MSRKDGQRLPYRGTLSCFFLELVDMHPRVHHIEKGVEPLQWWNGVKWDVYVPRYSIILRTGQAGVTRTVDVEVLTELELSRQARKWARIRHAYRDASRTLLIFTNRAVLAEPRLTNAMIVGTHAGKGIVPEADKDAVLSASQGSVTFTINGLVESGVLSYRQAYGAVLNLVASGELSFSLRRLFDGNTPVSRRA